ncbi:hypothetical protein BC629DRAFT_1590330 [Irpex lacteus]|nr:hypothetical protein BC629DRAFT_1590330 [Irpex lacteus]
MIRSTISSFARTAVASSSRRAFHTTPIAARTVSETAQDVNLKVGKSLASAIEKGEQAADATKQAVGGSSVKEVADKVNKSVGRVASAKAQEKLPLLAKSQPGCAGVREGKEDFKQDVKKELRK